MTSPTVPTWLLTALSSDKHITTGLRILATREAQRDEARRVSRHRVYEEESPPSTTKPSSNLKGALLLSLLGRQDLPTQTTEHYAVAVGSQLVHQTKNRYCDVIPYDRTRVVVHDGCVSHDSAPSDKYLNASWVLEKAGQKWWIAAQAPLPSSAHAFLSVMLQQTVQPPHSTAPRRTRVRTVVQLTRNLESGRRKADAYFPSQVGQSVVVPTDYGDDTHALKVTLIGTKGIPEADCLESTVSVVPLSEHGSDIQEPLLFKHLLYSSWPDHGVPEPEDRQSLLAFIRLVDSTNRTPSGSSSTTSIPDTDPPIIVGCSAGIGRTGSFIALSSLLRKCGFLQPAGFPTSPAVRPSSPLGSLPANVEEDEVVQEVDSLREQRPGMVQRQEQTLLIYEVLATAYGLDKVDFDRDSDQVA